MISTLQQATETLIREYDPDRIILFGSNATGVANEDSDFDILVVKETDMRPIDRRIEVERLLAPRSIPLDLLVYTPGEIHSLFLQGNPLIEEILKNGKVLFMRKETVMWLRDAQEDMDAAKLLQDHAHFRAACYHGQQCAEKALKALLLERGIIPKHTHDLLELLNEVTRLQWQVEVELDDLVFLNSVYRGRYPADVGLLSRGEPTREESNRATLVSERVLSEVQRLIS
jgi:uncharacterized protein